MDAEMAARLAASMDPKALGQLQNRNHDPAVARAVASQFGSFLMQGIMQDADGGAMSIAGDGTGSAAVSSMFASAMGRYAMSGDKLGLADMIYRSMAAKGAPSSTSDNSVAAGGATASKASTDSSASSGGLSLAPYWHDGGHRPIEQPTGPMTMPSGVHAQRQARPSDAAKAHDHTRAQQTQTPPASTAPPAKATATIESPANVPSAPAAQRVHWEGLSLPPQAHVLLPPPETSSPQVSTAETSPVTTAPSRETTPASSSAQVASQTTVAFGLPWSHQDRRMGADTAAGGAAGNNASVTPAANATAANDAERFAEEVAPAIQQAATRLGVSPRILLAQAALETGWGRSVVGNNIFGIKAGGAWSGNTVSAMTHEREGGHLVAHRGTFRSYATVGQAIDDYVSLVSASDRYRSALGAGDNIVAYANALAAGGYASDRNYAAKLVAVANSSKMSYAVASLDDATSGQIVSAHS